MNVAQFKEHLKTATNAEPLHALDATLKAENVADDAEIYRCHSCGHIGTKPGPKCIVGVAPLDCAFYTSTKDGVLCRS